MCAGVGTAISFKKNAGAGTAHRTGTGGNSYRKRIRLRACLTGVGAENNREVS